MPPSRSELEAMADDLGLTGSERAAFVGDVTPTPKPKSVEASKAAAQPTTTKAAPAAPKPKEPAKVTAFVDEPWPEYGPPAPAPTPKPREPGVGPRVAAGMEPLPSRNTADVGKLVSVGSRDLAAPVFTSAAGALFGDDGTNTMRSYFARREGFLDVMDNVERQRGIDAAELRTQSTPREPTSGPRVAAGMEPLPSPLMAKVAGVAGNVASKVYDARMALAGETPTLRDRVEDIEGFNRVMGNVEARRAADAQARMATAAATQPTAQKPTPAPQPTAAPNPAPAPAATPRDVAVGGTTFQQAYDGLILAGVPKAVIDERVKRGDPDAQRAVIEMYEKYAR